MTYWRFKKLAESLKEVSFPKWEMPKMELPSPTITEKEFLSPDGKLKLKYSSDWLEGGEEILKILNTPSPQRIEGKTLLFLYKVSWQKYIPAFLILQELPFTDLEKILKEIKEKEEGIEIVKLEKREKESWLEIKQKKKENSLFSFYAKGRIIFGKEKSYWLSIFSLLENWPDISLEAEKILNSVEFLE